MSENELTSYAKKLREDVLKILNDILPNAINEIITKVTNDYKRAQDTNPNLQQNETKANMNPIVHAEFRRFSNENYDYMTYMLRKREDIYFKLTRCKSLIALYDEHLAATPAYVPKKFRKDSYHLLSRAEYTKLHETELQRLKTEKEILKMRLTKFTSNLQELDTEIQNFVKLLQGPKKETKDAIMQRWVELTNADTERINNKWTKNISNLKTISTKDQEHLRKYLEQRFPTNDNTNMINFTRDIINNEPRHVSNTTQRNVPLAANNTITTTPTIDSLTVPFINSSSQINNSTEQLDFPSQPLNNTIHSPIDADTSIALIDLSSQIPQGTTHVPASLEDDMTHSSAYYASTNPDDQHNPENTEENDDTQHENNEINATETASKNDLRRAKPPAMIRKLRSSTCPERP